MELPVLDVEVPIYKRSNSGQNLNYYGGDNKVASRSSPNLRFNKNPFAALKRSPSLNHGLSIAAQEFSKSVDLEPKGASSKDRGSPRILVKADENRMHVMNTILKSSTESGIFQKFLNSRLCEENIMFWRDVESYHEMYNRNERHLDINPKNSICMNKIASNIWEKYLSENARFRINIDSIIVDKIRVDIHGSLEYSLFDSAQEFIYNLMKEDLLPKYLVSEYNQQKMDLEKEIERSPDRKQRGILLGTKVYVKDNFSLGMGTVVYVGEIENDNSTCVGLIFENPVGDCDGKVAGLEYFECEKNHGLFVPLDMIELKRDESSKTVGDGVKDILKRTFTHRRLSPITSRRSYQENDVLVNYVKELLSPNSTHESLENCKRAILSLSFQGPSICEFIAILDQQRNVEDLPLIKKWKERMALQRDSSREKIKIASTELLRNCPPLDIELCDKYKVMDKILITEDAFSILLNFVQSALVHANIHKDYKTARDLLFASSKFYMNQNRELVPIINRLKNITLWKDTQFWTELLKEKSPEKLKNTNLQNFCMVMLSFSINFSDVQSLLTNHAQHLAPEEVTQITNILNSFDKSLTEEVRQDNFDLYKWIHNNCAK